MGTRKTHPQQEGAGAAAASSSKAKVLWGPIFRNQSWGGLMVLLVAAIITGVAHFLATPAVRPLRLYDAGISLPQHPDSVSIVAAGLIPFAVMVVTVLLVEWVALRT
jgi:hypothetical protein